MASRQKVIFDFMTLFSFTKRPKMVKRKTGELMFRKKLAAHEPPVFLLFRHVA
jgi:hypothetical protein